MEHLYKDVSAADVLSWIFLSFGISLFVKYNWQRRHLYYHSSKIPGPFALPLIGSLHLMIHNRNDFFKGLMESIRTHPPVFKEWIGSQLYIITSRPEDVEHVLTTFLEKTPFYEFFNEYTKNSLLSAPVKMWKEHRKIINHSFNPKLINSFFDTFADKAKSLVKILGDNRGKEETDLIPKIWRLTFEISTVTLADLNPEHPDLANDIQNNCIPWVVRSEKLVIERLHTFWLHLNPLWKMSTPGREAKAVAEEMHTYFNKMLDMKLTEVNDNSSDFKTKRFLNYLIQDEKMSRNDIIEELKFMYMASSETTAITITNVLLALGIYQDVQERTHEELLSIFQSNRDATLEDLPKMEYLERVIKETMRILPVVPFIVRSVDKDTTVGTYVFPRGSDVIIPLGQIHKNSDLWPDPLKFDPDRFLPEIRRHRCAYIPFSFGVRNCIGFQYAMLSLKVTLAAIVRSFKVKTLKCKSIEDVELDFHVVTKPVNYSLILEKRV